MGAKLGQVMNFSCYLFVTHSNEGGLLVWWETRCIVYGAKEKREAVPKGWYLVVHRHVACTRLVSRKRLWLRSEGS